MLTYQILHVARFLVLLFKVYSPEIRIHVYKHTYIRKYIYLHPYTSSTTHIIVIIHMYHQVKFVAVRQTVTL